MKNLLSLVNKKNFMACIICFAFPSFSYAQNDLIVTQTSPTNAQTIQSGVPFSVGLSIKNNSGPALTGSQIYVITCYADNGTKKDTLGCATFTGTFVPIGAGATVGPFNVSCTYNFTTGGSGQICQSVYIQGGVDPNPANNVSCASVTLQAPTTTCNAPASASVTNVTATGATASWTAVTAATGYQVAATISATAPATGQDVASTSTPIIGLASNTKYYLHVRSKCGTTFSPWQSSTSFTTTGSACNAPASASVTNVTATGATASWTAVTAATGYQVAATISATAPATGQDVTGTTTPVTGLTKNTKYYLHVRTKCGTAFSSWQSSTSFTTANQTSVNTITNNQLGVFTYPNPATDRVVFSTDRTIEGRLLLSDLNGRVLISEPVNGSETNVSVAEIANGLYIYRVVDNRNAVLNTGKLTVVH